jgi:antirestriction protein
MTAVNRKLQRPANDLATGSPRIYVACLASYNNGRLHGKWIAADHPLEDMASEVRAMLAKSPEPGAEEWAIHDYEGFGSLRLGENERLARISAIATGISEHGPAFIAWLSRDFSRDLSKPNAFADAYRGEWESLRAYTEAYAQSTGLYRVAEKAGSPYIRVDVDALQRDLEMDVYTVPSGHGTVYVFDSNID